MRSHAQEGNLPPFDHQIRTHIGYGSPNKQDTAEAHGSPLGPEEVALTKERYGWDPAAQFVVPAPPRAPDAEGGQ